MRLFAAAILLFSTLCQADTVVYLLSGLPEGPEGGYSNIIFPFNIANTPHKFGYFFRHIFTYSDSREATVSIQPREDNNGIPTIGFGFRTTSYKRTLDLLNPNCKLVDRGKMIECNVIVPADYEHYYNVTLNKVGRNGWEVSVVDTTTDIITPMGSWTAESDENGIESKILGIINYYDKDFDIFNECSKLPYTSVTFGNAIAEGKQAGYRDPSLYDTCVGKTPFTPTRVPGGLQIDVGSKEN